jgi:REP element-mobilizing transposase RayT
MAYTYSQINIHAVFSVRGRNNLITNDIRGRVLEYLSGTIKGLGLFPLAVNGVEDHVHIFFELPPNTSISKALQEIKSNSSKWINEQQLIKGKFEWQAGFGAFANSRSQRNNVIKYILNQETHHNKTSFRDEYISLLERYEVKYDKNKLFEFYVTDEN